MKPDTHLHQGDVWNAVGSGGQITAHNLVTRQRTRSEWAEAHLAHMLGDSPEPGPRSRRPRLVNRLHLRATERLTSTRSRLA